MATPDRRPSPSNSPPPVVVRRSAVVTAASSVTVVPTPLALTCDASRHSARRCVGRSSGPGRCPLALVEKYGSNMRAERVVVHADAGVGDVTARPGAVPPAPRNVSVPPAGIACSAFSMMLITARPSSMRSTTTAGRSGATSSTIATRSARRRSRRARRPRAAARRPTSRRPRRSATSAKLENSDAICRSSRTCVRIVSTQAVEHRRQRLAAILVHAPQVLGRELDRRQRVLDVVRDLPGHLGPRLEAVGPLAAARAGAAARAAMLVERLDEPLQLVGRSARRRGCSRSPAAMRRRGARQALHRIADALGHPVAEAGAEQDEHQRAEVARRDRARRSRARSRAAAASAARSGSRRGRRRGPAPPPAGRRSRPDRSSPTKVGSRSMATAR